MKFSMTLLGLFVILSFSVAEENPTTSNNTNSTEDLLNKDMFVVHAMVYQVGILTNSTDDKDNSTDSGRQEAVTLFKTNGTALDLSKIPPPIRNIVATPELQALVPLPNATAPLLQEFIPLPNATAPLIKLF